MNTLLFFFAIPIAIIILSSIFQTIIKCPMKIAGIIFSAFLIVAFALTANTEELLIATIIYTIISYISAYITCIIMNGNWNFNCCDNTTCCREDNNNIPICGNGCSNIYENTNFSIPTNSQFTNNLSNNLNTNFTDNSNTNNLNETNCPYRRYR